MSRIEAMDEYEFEDEVRRWVEMEMLDQRIEVDWDATFDNFKTEAEEVTLAGETYFYHEDLV